MSGSLPQIDKMKGQEPPMYLQRPSSARSQDVSHILAQTFRDLYTRDAIGPDTVHYLYKSRGGDDEYHEKYVQALKKVQDEHERRMAEAAMLERHIMQAQARAMSADERALNRANSFPDLGLPPQRSHLRACIDSALLRKHNLLTPEDFAAEETPVVPPPSGPLIASYARDTASSSKRKEGVLDESFPNTGRDSQSLPDGPLECDLDGDSSARYSYESLPKLGDSLTASKGLWKKQMNPEEREINRADLANLENRVDYLKNPRHIPPSAAPGKSLLRQHKKQAKEVGIKSQPISQGKKEPTTVFLAQPAEVVFSEYTVGKVFEITLELKNVTSCMQPVRVIPPKTQYFSVGLGQFPGEAGLVAPGMSCRFNVQFSPDSLGDVTDELRIETQSKTPLVIPLLGRRPSPHLSIPETINVDHCLVGGMKILEYTVKNEGGKGRFCLMPRSAWPTTNFKSTTSVGYVNIAPFQIRPCVFELGPKESKTVEILFMPTETTKYQEEITIVCDNCQVRHFTLIGEGQQAGVEVVSMEGGLAEPEPGELCDVTARHLMKFDHLNPFTYVQRVLTILNTTNVELPFTWVVVKPCLKAKDPAESDVLQIPTERIQDVDSAFYIDPPQGTLPAGGTAEFVITFGPPKVADYHSVLHLLLRDIPRIPEPETETESKPQTPEKKKPSSASNPALAIEGRLEDMTALEVEAKGTCSPLSVLVQPYAMHIPGQVLVETAIKRPLRMVNQSISPILFQWENVSSSYILQVEPPIGELGAQSEMDIELTISGTEPGTIDHTLLCYIQHMEDPLTLHIQAEFKGAEVIFDQAELNFGLVRYGDRVEQPLDIRNTSRVPARWSIQQAIPSLAEGEEESHGLSMDANEFTFSEEEGELMPLESKQIIVQFEPLHCRTLNTVFELTVINGNQSEFRGLKEFLGLTKLKFPPGAVMVRAEVQRPAACLLQCLLQPEQVYIDVPTTHQVSLLNQTQLDTTFQWVEAEGLDAEFCSISVEPSSGNLAAREQLEFDVYLTVRKLGEVGDLRVPCLIGGMDKPVLLSIAANVKGLSVAYRTPNLQLEALEEDQPETEQELKIDFGSEVKIGDVPSRLIYIRNNSAISAAFSVTVGYFIAKPPTPPTSSPTTYLIKSAQRRPMLSKTPNLADPHTKTPSRAHTELSRAMLKTGNGTAFNVSPASGILQPFAEQVIEVKAFSDMWGTYNDTITCKVEGLDPVIIPVSVTTVGCPLLFQMMAAQPGQQPVLRLGTHVSGVGPIHRQMRINNNGPTDVRLDWRVFNQKESDDQLLDMLCSFGPAFPLLDQNGEEVLPEFEAPAPPPRPPTEQIPNSPDSTPATSRQQSEVMVPTPVENTRPKVISLTMREHGGTESYSPYTITPQQLIVPARGNKYININFMPYPTEEVTQYMDCNSFALGYMSLDNQDSLDPNLVQRLQGYEVTPLRLEMTSRIKPALLTIECTEEDGMLYRAAASDLIQNDQVQNQSLKICSANLRNETETPLVFHLETAEPFNIVNLDANKRPASQLLQTSQITLPPRHTMPVHVAFCVTSELLQCANMEKNEEEDGENQLVRVQRLEAERRVHFNQQLLVKFNNNAMQSLALSAMLLVPTLRLSKEAIDFGTCLVGQRREMQLILSNPTGSHSYWHCIQDERSDTCTKDTFEVTPSDGMLDAFITHISKNKVLLRIYFTAKHSENYEATYLFHGDLGEETCRLTVQGQGSYDGKHEALVNI